MSPGLTSCCGERRSAPSSSPSNGAATYLHERSRPALVSCGVPRLPLSLVEFPADDPERALRFWTELLQIELNARDTSDGEGWQTHATDPGLGLHARGRGPGDSFSLPYFAMSDIDEALQRVCTPGGSVVHPGERWAICKDSEGSPFGLSQDPAE